MVEIVNMSQMLNVLWKCSLTMTAMVKSSAQIEPFTFQKVRKYALLYSSVIVLKISREFLLLQQLEIHPCWIYRSGSPEYVIMIGETFMHLRVKELMS